MKNQRLKLKFFRQLPEALILFSLMFLPHSHVWSSEPDPNLIETARLADSTKEIEFYVYRMFSGVISRANNILQEIEANKLRVVDRVVKRPKGPPRRIYKQFDSIEEAAEYAFSLGYFERSFYQSENFAIHPLERILTLTTKAQGSGLGSKIESSIIQFTSQFPELVNGVVANYCGQNFGLDKVSHFFGDGYLMYNKLREGSLKDEEDIRNLSDLFERGTMGLDLTGVYSAADIEANVRGATFFQDLFLKKVIAVGASGRLVLNKEKLRFCDYFDDSLSEKFNPNRYRFIDQNQFARLESQTEGSTCDVCSDQNPTMSSSVSKSLANIHLYLILASSSVKHGLLERFSPKYPQRIYNALLGYANKPRP